jgi:Zn finger protein HypA/HybF involved in hydrogenase expression
MGCYMCDEIVNEEHEYVYCKNCDNKFHMECVNTGELCPVCEEENSLDMIWK